jgi:phosphatidylglycerol phospholipase C
LEWREIEPFRTIQQPSEPMPRLRDLLEYLSEPGLEDIWVLLDIKVSQTALVEEQG